jgi:hypothetical protein
VFLARETSAPEPGPPCVVEALPPSAASDLHVVKMTREADLVATETLTRVLLEAAGSTVVADVSGVTFIDASAVGAFVCAKQKIESSIITSPSEERRGSCAACSTCWS